MWWPYLNFDTSLRPGDTRDPRHYDCAPETRLVPMITLVFDNGQTLTVADEDMVLNTGGVLHAACFAENQAAPWTPVDPANIVATP